MTPPLLREPLVPNQLENCAPRRHGVWAVAAIFIVAGLAWFVVTGGWRGLSISAASIVALLACALPCTVPLIIARLWLRRRGTHAVSED